MFKKKKYNNEINVHENYNYYRDDNTGNRSRNRNRNNRENRNISREIIIRNDEVALNRINVIRNSILQEEIFIIKINEIVNNNNDDNLESNINKIKEILLKRINDLVLFNENLERILDYELSENTAVNNYLKRHIRTIVKSEINNELLILNNYLYSNNINRNNVYINNVQDFNNNIINRFNNSLVDNIPIINSINNSNNINNTYVHPYDLIKYTNEINELDSDTILFINEIREKIIVKINLYMTEYNNELKNRLFIKNIENEDVNEKTILNEKNTEEDVCCICLENCKIDKDYQHKKIKIPYENNDLIVERENSNGIVRMKCKHVFHTKCIYNWVYSTFEPKIECPMCKQDLFDD